MNGTGQIYGMQREERLCELARLCAVPARGPLEEQLERLKERLLKPAVHQAFDAALAKELIWAANEAAALAWYSGYPTLVFPGLFEEKVHAARKHWEKQQLLFECMAA